LSINAVKRLNALERHAHYGGGYEIAMRDLEIRGSGNVFGTEQSGHIANIGYHLYTRILKETLEMLKEMQGEDAVVFPVPDVSVDLEMQIPPSYIESGVERVASYRRIAEAQTKDRLLLIRGELRDRFGRLPEPTENLIDGALVKVLGQTTGLRSIQVKGDKIQCDFLPEHVEQAGSEIIKNLSRALGETNLKVEIMNNRALTFIIHHNRPETPLKSLRLFLESLASPTKFSD
jgi:transcription-repair coupling factor (superfamily II helicase)